MELIKKIKQVYAQEVVGKAGVNAVYLTKQYEKYRVYMTKRYYHS